MSPIPLGIFAVSGAGPAPVINDFDLLETTLISSNTASVTFSSLDSYASAGYKHFQIRGTVRGDDGNTLWMRLNGDTGANYSRHQLTATGSTVSSSFSSTTRMNVCFAMANSGNNTNVFSAFVADILDFSSSNKNTTVRSLGGNTQQTGFNTALGLFSGVWRNTSAITSITLLPDTGNLVSGTRFSLYGVK